MVALLQNQGLDGWARNCFQNVSETEHGRLPTSDLLLEHGRLPTSDQLLEHGRLPTSDQLLE